jgi:hypothetical protein
VTYQLIPAQVGQFATAVAAVLDSPHRGTVVVAAAAAVVVVALAAVVVFSVNGDTGGSARGDVIVALSSRPTQPPAWQRFLWTELQLGPLFFEQSFDRCDRVLRGGRRR